MPSHPVCFLPTLQSYTLRYQFCFGTTISLRPIQCHLLMCCSYEIKRWTIPPSSDPKSKLIQAAIYRLPKTTQTSVKGRLLWMVEYGCACGCAIDGKNKRWEILETTKKVNFFSVFSLVELTWVKTDLSFICRARRYNRTTYLSATCIWYPSNIFTRLPKGVTVASPFSHLSLTKLFLLIYDSIQGIY